MAGYRFWLQGCLSVVIALMIVQTGRTQSGVPPKIFTGPLGEREPGTMFTGGSGGPGSYSLNAVLVEKSAEAAASTCKVYSLSDMGDDPALGKWIADTIPEMIQAGSWKQGGVKISYFAPGKVLVINHTPAVHAKVDEFLQSVKKSLPTKTARHDRSVVPAQFAVPDRSVEPMPTQSLGYPVASPLKAPKHLFHFIIRYEGEGIIDSNVAEFAKTLSGVSAISERSSMPSTVMPTTGSNSTSGSLQSVEPSVIWSPVPPTGLQGATNIPPSPVKTLPWLPATQPRIMPPADGEAVVQPRSSPIAPIIAR